MKKYDSFQDGYIQGMFVLINDLRELTEYLESQPMSKDDFVDELKKLINDGLSMHIAAKGYGLTQEVYDIWVNKSKIIRTDVKYKLIGNLMEYED
jgi:hypothetical protein